MRVPSRKAIAAATLLTFVLAAHLQSFLVLSPLYRSLYQQFPFYVPESGKSTLQILLCAAMLALLYRIGPRGITRELGLAKSARRAVAFGFVASLPLLLGLTFWGDLARDFSWPKELYVSFYGNLAEDVLFTGFAFHQLHHRVRWPFWTAVLLIAMLFGLGHVEKGTTLGQVVGLFLIPGLGAALFAWLFVQWGENLWVPFALHCFMDVWWNLFAVGPTVLGGAFPFVLQILTAAAAIALTLWWRSSVMRRELEASVLPQA